MNRIHLYSLFQVSMDPDVTFKGVQRTRPTYERIDARAFTLAKARIYWAEKLTGRDDLVLRTVGAKR